MDDNIIIKDPIFLKEMNVARERHSFISMNNFNLIVVGGTNTNTCEKYNFFTNKWEMLPSLKNNKYDTSLCLMNKVDLYLFFGF